MNHIKKLCTARTQVEPTGCPTVHAKTVICRLYARKYGYTDALCKLQIRLTVQPLHISPVTYNCLEDQSSCMEEPTRTCARDHCFIRSLIIPTPASGGRGVGTCCTVQQTICSHTSIPLGLLSRPLDSRATAHNGRWPNREVSV